MIAGASGRPRVLFIGMSCAGSEPPLRALMAADVDLRAVVVPRGHAASPIGDLVRAAGVPILEVAEARRAATVAAIAAHRPDIIAVACFPWRLSPALLAVPTFGAVNVHPSLLPAGRGPEPLFWTFRRGERRTGVTLHLLDDGFDTGPVVAQEAIDLPDDIRLPELEAQLMEQGGALLVEVIHRLHRGELHPVPQDDAQATDAPTPSTADFAVPTNLPARWAYRFVRGVAPRGGSLELLVLATGERYPLANALGYDASDTQSEPVRNEGNGVLRVRFQPGTARLLVRDE
jgi:methionyl-tRNA formyltransferase